MANTRLHKRRNVFNTGIVSGFDIFTAFLMKITVVWVMTPCLLVILYLKKEAESSPEA
jgi:hypothetical protein